MNFIAILLVLIIAPAQLFAPAPLLSEAFLKSTEVKSLLLSPPGFRKVVTPLIRTSGGLRT